MRILKSYTDASTMTGQGFDMPNNAEPKEKSSAKAQIKVSGDSVRLSPEAIEMLENGSMESLSVCAHDATYDQYGNITRQVDALNRDLNNLAMATYPAGAAISSKVNTLRSQLNSLRASV